jgi:mannose-6-phosphate isomerase-like protein (cupin superfamily)
VDFWQLNEEELEPRSPRVLHTGEGASRVILLALPEGELLQEHEVREHALLFLLEGGLAVSAGDSSAEVSAPALVRFDPAERHEVRATSDARLVLSLAPWPGDGWHDHHAPEPA